MANRTPRIKCSCTHEYQDSIYGKGMRATTPVNTDQDRKPPIITVRCTVCGKEQTLGQSNF